MSFFNSVIIVFLCRSPCDLYENLLTLSPAAFTRGVQGLVTVLLNSALSHEMAHSVEYDIPNVAFTFEKVF